MLASNLLEQGKLKQHVEKTCFKELACQEQLEGKWAGKLEIIKNPCKKHCFLKARGAPRWAQEGSRNYLARFIRCASHLFGPILGPSWAILGPPWPFLGGPGGHLEADVGFGRLDLGVQGGQKLRCQKPLKKTKEHLCFLPMCGGPLWAHLGPILGYLGPSLALLGGSRRAS